VSPDPLPWERDAGAEGVGVCLSGGGIRAASFALGAVQALQVERGLLWGRRSADHLAVVSGGSYLAATLMLNAAKLAKEGDRDGCAPLAECSPEARWVVGHGEYLREGGGAAMLLRFGAPFLLNVLAFVALFVWAGTILAGVAVVLEEDGPSWLDAWSGDAVFAGAALALLVGGGLLLRGIYKDGGWQRTVLPLVGILVLYALSPSVVAAMERADWLSDTTWWYFWRRPEVLLILLGALVLVAIASLLAWKPAFGQDVTVAINRVAVFVPRLGGLVLLSLVVTSAADWFADAPDSDVGYYLAILVGGIAFSWVMARVSLHTTYRRRLSACFAVRRNANDVDLLAPTAAKLADLAPPAGDPDLSHPRLLVCATANVVTGRWRDRTKRTFLPFVMSHDCCGIPGRPGDAFDTAALEQLTVPAGLPVLGGEPQLSLMTSVASTGAAVSPSMGNKTMPAARALIAIINVRLGRWLPNPLSTRIRAEVEAGNLGKHRALGGGYDEFVPELFGMHRSDAPRIYISDGGHYDNLGLLALLAARCEEIWCVDSADDKHGKAGQLQQVIDLAEKELATTIELRHEVFAGKDGILGAGHAIAPIRYPDGAEGTLVVIKLGLTAGSDPDLKQRRLTVDRKFPYHSTFLYPAFDPGRLDAYRRLGVENARAAARAAEKSLAAS
jgi:hypothetical protein